MQSVKDIIRNWAFLQFQLYLAELPEEEQRAILDLLRDLPEGYEEIVFGRSGEE